MTRKLSTTAFIFLGLAASPGISLSQLSASVAVPSTLSLVLQRLGGQAPSSSVLSGTVSITAGSTHEDGTVRIVTKDTTQTAEAYNTATINRRTVFSKGLSAEQRADGLKEMPFARTLSALSSITPISFLAAKASDPALNIVDLGLENSGDIAVRHLRLNQVWANDKNLAVYQDFTIYDVLLDRTTLLPKSISYKQREGLGATPWIAVQVLYDDYRAVNGLTYPFHITKFVNGSQWADIHLTSILLNTPVSDSEFAIK